MALALALGLLSSSVARADSLIIDVKASGHQQGHPPQHALDGQPSTRWAIEGKDQWLAVEFNQTVEIAQVKLGFARANRRRRLDKQE